ncbi:LytR family transcriptional regulator [Paenarthrobacter nitroguajacolicus]|uniref:LytR family transcriptional regulator n=1 Tax=Paenarthrobacter nitroguajacolicus TaxID=211146 RepID=A0A558HBD9_PAENT|nr:LCP family protein [Paenarthrobacter nitroguajacolicus]TVU66455.1 LytR family transcriptional regulator [Paenarthrobacter nitroguajacolicus]
MRRRDARPEGTGTAGSVAARHGEAADGTPRHMKAPKGLPLWLKIVTGVLSLTLVAGVAFAAFWFIRLQNNITKAPLSAGETRDSGEALANDKSDRLQILILGSDTRDGKNADYGSTEDSTGYGHSDVMMLLDISADNKRVSVMSFPRDLLVDVPQCTDRTNNQTFPARSGVMINEAMAEAGIGCAVDTVNKLTGLEIDHFMMADFNAVKELSKAIGGVNVCVSDPVFDPDSRLRLPKGDSMVEGEQALAFLRTRHAFGDGGDLGRIKGQQAFLSSLTRKLKDEGTLGNPQRLLQIADVVTQNLTVDEGLASVPSLLTIGGRLKDIDVSKVAFVAVPTQAAAVDPNRLELIEPQASQLFAALRADLDLTNPGATSSPAATESPAPQPTATTPVAPAYNKAIQPVAVANGSGVATRAQEIMAVLTGNGFTQAVSYLANPVDQTVVYYGTGFADVAADVATLYGIPAAQVQEAPGVAGVQLYVGTDFGTGTAYGAASVPSDVVNQTASDAVCQQVNPLYIDQ